MRKAMKPPWVVVQFFPENFPQHQLPEFSILLLYTELERTTTFWRDFQESTELPPRYTIHVAVAKHRMIVLMKQPVMSMMIMVESLSFNFSDSNGMAMNCAVIPITPRTTVYVV